MKYIYIVYNGLFQTGWCGGIRHHTVDNIIDCDYITITVDVTGAVILTIKEFNSLGIRPSSTNIEDDLHKLQKEGIRGSIIFLEQPLHISSYIKVDIYGMEITEHGIWYIDYRLIAGKKVLRNG